jgi:hypothetical protein
MFISHLDDDLKVKSPIIQVFDMLLESFEKSCFENLWEKPFRCHPSWGATKDFIGKRLMFFSKSKLG